MILANTLRRFISYNKKGKLNGINGKQMFHVIKDVDKYKEFLKMATDSYISNMYIPSIIQVVKITTISTAL